MAGTDPLGLTPKQRAAADRPAINPNDIDVLVIGIRADEAEVRERGLYCPAAVPCLGRPGVRVVVPVRITDGPRQGEIVDEARATYCPGCRTMATDPERAA